LAGAAGAGTGTAAGEHGDTALLQLAEQVLTSVHFYHEEKHLRGANDGTELSLSPLQLHHRGRYRCRGWLTTEVQQWRELELVTVTVHMPVANATITPSPPAQQVHTGDPVTLHCSVQMGSTSVNFTWLHDGQEVVQSPVLELGDISVGHSGTYQCVATNQLGQDGHCMFRALSPDLALEVTPGSPQVTAQTIGLTGAQTTQLLVEPPWRPAVLWDRVTLTCQGSGTASATTWYINGRECWKEGPNNFAVNRSGTYQCDRPGSGFSPPMRVLNDRLVLQVPAWPLLEGDTVTLRCRGRHNTSVTGVQFYHENEEVWSPLPGTELSLSPLQLNHSGQYRCRGWLKTGESWQWQQSAPVNVTVHVPVANATITPSPPAHQVHTGDNVTLHCSVQVGSAPVTFTWLHNGREVARGPVLELVDVDVGHSGTYQCVATNQLGQDGHRVLQALSPELPLEVTSWGHGGTVAAGVVGSLLFLVLLMGIIMAFHWWHRMGG
ncbi:hypothetical protein HGM15179_020960, partial [Zosterops borbonicus]